MRKDGVNKLTAKYSKTTLRKGDIEKNFTKLMNRRDIRNAIVSKLFRLLEQDGHFETPLMTNVVNGKQRLLDGNHRIEAIERYLTKYPQRKVEINIFYYEKLSEEEEKEIYTKWNLGTKQTTNDFVKQYWNSIPIAKMFDNMNFPFGVSHIWTAKAMEFKTLVGAYLTKNTPTFQGGFQGSAIKFIEKAKELDVKDFKVLSTFMKEYIEIFGVPNKRNAHYKQSVFYSLMRIWNDNSTIVGYETMRNALIRLRGHERVIYYSSLGGTREICVQCRKDLLDVMNGRRKNKIFI